MKRRYGLTLLFSLVALAGPARPVAAIAAQDEQVGIRVYGGSAEKLIEECSAVNRMTPDNRINPADAPALSFCTGYISGIVDFHQLVIADQKTKGPYCVPGGNVTFYQLARIVLKYGNDHPEELHLAAALVVTEALTRAFPCS